MSTVPATGQGVASEAIAPDTVHSAAPVADSAVAAAGATGSAPTLRDPAQRPPRASATIVVVRDGDAGLEVLLLRRAERGDQNSGAWVFPGGLVDAGDHECADLCGAVSEAEVNAHLKTERGLGYLVAAVRECFEECGLLYARPVRGDAPLVRFGGETAEAFDAWRGPLHRNERSLREFCEGAGLQLAVDQLVYFSHWVTPLGRAKRFDTRFFIAAMPHGQSAVHDGTELVEQRWVRPVDALAADAGLHLMTPTRTTLELLRPHASAQAVMAWAAARGPVEQTQPHLGSGSGGTRPVLPHEPAWAELRRLDPQGAGTASYELVPGRAVRLSERVIRVTAANASVMTGPGTNTYLVGDLDANVWAVVDPGPPDSAHVDAVLAAAPGPIRWILATHTHLDHSPATVALRERTGAAVLGRIADHPERQDGSFAPDAWLEDDERVALGAGTTLRALRTPGHASNHLCFLLEEERLLFTGDHVMQMSTVVINPPDGDMAAYIGSLASLLSLELEWLAPGHGFLMDQPHQAIRAVIAHRGRREAKVRDALSRLGDADATALLRAVYDDVPDRLHPVAARSLLAHLLKLQGEGVARHAGERWSLVG